MSESIDNNPNYRGGLRPASDASDEAAKFAGRIAAMLWKGDRPRVDADPVPDGGDPVIRVFGTLALGPLRGARSIPAEELLPRSMPDQQPPADS